MSNPVRFAQRAHGGYYVLMVADKQPWAARLTASDDGEGVKFAWLKVRRARAEERALLKAEEGRAWAGIIETNDEQVISVGRIDEAYHGRSGYTFHISRLGIARISRDEADEILLHPSTAEEVAVSGWDKDMPF